MLLGLMDLLFYRSRASLYATISAASTEAFYIATGRSVQQALGTVTVLMVIALVAAHCDSKGSFKGRYEQL